MMHGESEPDIRVAIVMPEDRFERIQLSPEFGITLQVETDEGVFETTSDLTIECAGDPNEVCVVLGDMRVTSKNAVLSATRPATTAPSLRIREVVTGRGYHWQKTLDQAFCGSFFISRKSDFLLAVNVVPLEHYLACVATSEMSAECPLDLLKAQTVAARSWFFALIAGNLQKHKDLDVEVCNDDCCQRYQGTTFLTARAEAAARETRGQIMVCAGEICDTRYSKCCGGITENSENVWPITNAIYLRGLPDSAVGNSSPDPGLNENQAHEWLLSDPEAFCGAARVRGAGLTKFLGSVDAEGDYFRWSVHLTQEDANRLIGRALPEPSNHVTTLTPVRRGVSGRILELRVDYIDLAGAAKSHLIRGEYQIRAALSEKFLFSSAFVVEEDTDEEGLRSGFTLRGAGWGHGVGLCQIGALEMSLRGYSHDEILRHYYRGGRLEQQYQ